MPARGQVRDRIVEHILITYHQHWNVALIDPTLDMLTPAAEPLAQLRAARSAHRCVGVAESVNGALQILA
ncbi:MAG: hypothetical protein WC729_09240 [Sphingomonas sp.]|jgi:hypothetical protein